MHSTGTKLTIGIREWTDWKAVTDQESQALKRYQEASVVTKVGTS